MADKLRFKIKTPPAAKAKADAPKVLERDEVAREVAAKALRPYAEYDSPVLEILGVPYGGHLLGRDAYGEAFHEGTGIWLQVGDVVNMTYYHGFGPDDPWYWQNPPVVIGRAIYMGDNEQGHWFEGKVDTTEELARRCMDALNEGREVRASSGAVSHLVRYGEAGLIDVWPIGELAIFDTTDERRPANELAIVQLKSDATADEAEATAKAGPAKAGASAKTDGRDGGDGGQTAKRLLLELELLDLS